MSAQGPHVMVHREMLEAMKACIATLEAENAALKERVAEVESENTALWAKLDERIDQAADLAALREQLQARDNLLQSTVGLHAKALNQATALRRKLARRRLAEMTAKWPVAPAPASPDESAMPKCLRPMTDEEQEAYAPLPREAIREAARRGERDRAAALGATVAAPMCRPWCGMHEDDFLAAGYAVRWSGKIGFCADPCRAAGRPLNPTREP
jgi:hypothetical protein